MGFLRRFFARRAEHVHIAERFRLSPELESQFRQSVGIVKYLDREQELKNLLACVERGASDEVLQQAVHEYTAISQEEFDSMWPLFESALPSDQTLSNLAAKLGTMIKPIRWQDSPPERKEGGSRIIDITNYYESLARFFGSFDRTDETRQVRRQILEVCKQLNDRSDGQKVATLALSLAWLRDRDSSSKMFAKALELLNADQMIVSAVRDGEWAVAQISQSGYHMAVVPYLKRAEKFPTREDTDPVSREPVLVEPWRQ